MANRKTIGVSPAPDDAVRLRVALSGFGFLVSDDGKLLGDELLGGPGGPLFDPPTPPDLLSRIRGSGNQLTATRVSRVLNVERRSGAGAGPVVHKIISMLGAAERRLIVAADERSFMGAVSMMSTAVWTHRRLLERFLGHHIAQALDEVSSETVWPLLGLIKDEDGGDAVIVAPDRGRGFAKGLESAVDPMREAALEQELRAAAVLEEVRIMVRFVGVSEADQSDILEAFVAVAARVPADDADMMDRVGGDRVEPDVKAASGMTAAPLDERNLFMPDDPIDDDSETAEDRARELRFASERLAVRAIDDLVTHIEALPPEEAEARVAEIEARVVAAAEEAEAGFRTVSAALAAERARSRSIVGAILAAH